MATPRRRSECNNVTLLRKPPNGIFAYHRPIMFQTNRLQPPPGHNPFSHYPVVNLVTNVVRVICGIAAHDANELGWLWPGLIITSQWRLVGTCTVDSLTPNPRPFVPP